MQKAQPPLPVGSMIQGHYLIESLPGNGDFGNVYLVRDQRDKQQLFALMEIIHPERYHFALEYLSPTPLDRRALPSIQYVFNDESSGRAYVLMSYIEGQNLELLRLQQAEKRFPWPQVVDVMVPICNAIIHLHQQNPPRFHQNVQPANIFIASEARAPILAILAVVRRSGSTITPLHYFSPGFTALEQYTGEASARTDVYGLGATCYTLLTGIVPPDALDRSTFRANGGADSLKPVHEIIPDIPSSLDEAIQRAMAIDAGERFSSVEQFREAIGFPAMQFSTTRNMLLASVSPPTILGAEAEEPASEPPLKLPETSLPPLSPLAPHRSRKIGLAFVMLALLIFLGIGTQIWFHARSLPAAQSTPTIILSTPASSSTPVPTPSIYPIIKGTYVGTIYDLSTNIRTNITLSNIQQNQNHISGYLTLGSNMPGSGPFRGTIDKREQMQFIVKDTAKNIWLWFEGILQSPANLIGDFHQCSPSSATQEDHCSQLAGSYGIWDATQSSS